ncbi:hypothetical protein LWI29_015450 [Acer saccharum]|uniref:Uncharacterized protein n=1 Tax=Acer saccharum TaxID=4024 RepID=A0AA39T7S2_ACESA|nr:hypothetical protein LWI29_015450 [Acer saccharum]
MLKIWGNEPRERARGGQTTCGHLASPCGRPWAPRAREPSAPVGPTRPPRGADVAAREEGGDDDDDELGEPCDVDGELVLGEE